MRENVTIREAISSDKEWVIKMMNDCLSPYYDGNHTAHAERIFAAHLQGGTDNIGFFSFEQKMFIATINDKVVGMIHIVGKKQNTYKISPLIILPCARGKGIGKYLLNYVEKYVFEKHNIRQIYCTVADTNDSAKGFFEHNGFIKAGTADSQYKIGVAEDMYYKPIDFKHIVDELEVGTVSVIELCEAQDYVKELVRDELLRELPYYFEGIDNAWVDSLFRGYERRNTGEVNQKYKLIYVAINQDGDLVGIAAATPKKGAPIKVMPLIAKSKVALIALLTDLPYQLSKYGRKLYVHITPTVDEVKLLQLKGWSHDSDLPEAYRQGVITQQWSYEFKSNITRFIRVKEPFLRAIKDKKKTIEIRVGYETIKDIKVGDKINFITFTDCVCVKIKRIQSYVSLENMFEYENYMNIMPWATDEDSVKKVLNKFYPLEKVAKFGILAFHFEIDTAERSRND